MKAFVFAPSNEFKGKFNVSNLEAVPHEFQQFLVTNPVDLYDYVECGGKTWTILEGPDGLELAEGRTLSSVSEKIPHRIPIATTETLEGYRIIDSCGVVFGEAIFGANAIRDIAASFTDFFGGRSGSYESKLKHGREVAIQEMMEEACKLKGEAVVGVRIDYETIGSSSSMLMICASGTAVTIEPITGEQGGAGNA